MGMHDEARQMAGARSRAEQEQAAEVLAQVRRWNSDVRECAAEFARAASSEGLRLDGSRFGGRWIVYVPFNISTDYDGRRASIAVGRDGSIMTAELVDRGIDRRGTWKWRPYKSPSVTYWDLKNLASTDQVRGAFTRELADRMRQR